MTMLNPYIQAMPKVELHVHLEGTIQPDTLLELARRNGVSLPSSNADELRHWYRFRDFDHFISIFMTICDCLQTPEDFTCIAYEYGRAMAQQNIRYAEVTWTPFTHVNESLSFSDVLAAVNAGRERAHAEWGVKMQWVCDIVRSFPDTANQVVQWVTSPEARAGGVIALGLGGPEARWPPDPFEEVFSSAVAQGMHSSPHAGETAGPASIWSALRALQAERIGHGVRCVEDPALVTYLIEHHIPLEVNPTSNLCLGVSQSYDAHPLRQLFEAGVCVTINSDDPALFNTTLNDEYVHAVMDCGLSVTQLEQAALNAVDACFLPEAEKVAMRADFLAQYTQLRAQHGIQETGAS